MMSDDQGPVRIEKAQYICAVPRELGKVTKIKMSNGQAVVETESGIKMIVPTGKRSVK